MRKTLAAVAAVVTVPFVAPAEAATAMTMNCGFSYGWPYGTANCTATGASSGHGLANGAATFRFTSINGCPGQSGMSEPPGAFAWTRTGPVGHITFYGAQSGSGVMTFDSPCPLDGETVTITFGTT